MDDVNKMKQKRTKRKMMGMLLRKRPSLRHAEVKDVRHHMSHPKARLMSWCRSTAGSVKKGIGNSYANHQN